MFWDILKLAFGSTNHSPTTDRLDLFIQVRGEGQYQWMTVSSASGVGSSDYSYQILNMMEDVANKWPGYQVRAVDSNGRLLDML